MKVDYNYFELAGFSKEESEQLLQICHKSNIPYDVMRSVLLSFLIEDEEIEVIESE